MKCCYCESEFKTAKILAQHQKTAKYCLKIQDSRNGNYSCKTCRKEFTTKIDLKEHAYSCVCEKCQEKVKILTKLFENRTQELLRQLSEKDKIIERLEGRLENVAVKAALKPTNTQINNLIPITDAHLAEQAQYLTIEHIKNGAQGFAKYAVEYPLKDRVLCMDYSRRKVCYKNEEDKVVTDPEMTELTKKLFSACESRNTNLIKKCREELLEILLKRTRTLPEEMTDEETELVSKTNDEIFKVIENITSYNNQVHEISLGLKPDLYSEFVKEVCGQIKQR